MLVRNSLFLPLVLIAVAAVGCEANHSGRSKQPASPDSDKTTETGKVDEGKKSEKDQAQTQDNNQEGENLAKNQEDQEETPAADKDQDKPLTSPIVSTWEDCEPTSEYYQNKNILSQGHGYVFKSDGHFEEYTTIFKAADCQQPLTQEQAIQAGLAADFIAFWNEKSTGTYVAGEADANGIASIDLIYNDDELFYLVFKIEGTKLLISNFCRSRTPSGDCVITGNSAANRETRLDSALAYIRK